MKERITFIIQYLKISKTKFAEVLNVSPAFVSQICSGAREPSDRTITDICREFGCNEAWLRTGEGEPFREMSKEEEIMRLAVQTVKGSDEFRKTFVSMLAKLTPDDWANLANIFEKLNQDSKKE